MELKPLQTLSILLVFLLVGGPAAWFTMQGFQPTGPGDVGLDGQGRLYAHYHEKIFSFDDLGQNAGVHRLDRIGASGLWGGLSFFPNGDWLISPEGGPSSGSLHRCSTSGGLSCAPLENIDRGFARTFRTFVASEDLFYLSDSARHSLTAHSSAGEQLAQSKEKLRHPGEVKRYGNLLAVADVDHYRMKVFQLDSESGLWVGEPRSFDTLATDVQETMINQPVDFILHDDVWYVLVKDVSMAFARLRRYTLAGEYIDHLPLPDNGMIMAIEKHGQAIVLSDFRSSRLLRIGLEGEPLPDLSSTDWERYKEALSSAGRLNRWIGVSLWALFAVLLIAGFAIAIKSQKSQQMVSEVGEQDSLVQDDLTPPSVHDPDIQWLQRSKSLDWLMGFLGLTLIAAFSYGFSMQGDCTARSIQVIMYGMGILVLLIAVPFYVIWNRSRRLRLGVLRNWIIVELADGTVWRSLASDLCHVRQTLIYVAGHKVMLGPPNNRFLNKKDFDQYLEPLLKQAKALSGRELYSFRWVNDKSGLVAEGVVVVLALALMFGIFSGGEVYLEDKLTALVETCETSQAVRPKKGPVAD